MNDSKLNGESKERARQAIEKGCAGYPNGQQEECASVGCARTIRCEAHEVVLLGDQLGDFTDDFANKD